MIQCLRDRCRIRFFGFCDTIDYWEPPAWWIYVCLLTLVSGAFMLLPREAVGIAIGIGLFAVVLFAALVPCWVAALAVWEGVIEWAYAMLMARRESRKRARAIVTLPS